MEMSADSNVIRRTIVAFANIFEIEYCNPTTTLLDSHHTVDFEHFDFARFVITFSTELLELFIDFFVIVFIVGCVEHSRFSNTFFFAQSVVDFTLNIYHMAFLLEERNEWHE